MYTSVLVSAWPRMDQLLSQQAIEAAMQPSACTGKLQETCLGEVAVHM